MEKLNEILLEILEMNFTASLIIFAVIFARQVLKKAPKILSYALWIVVLFRLVCPFSFESALSVVPEEIPIDYGRNLPAVTQIDNSFTGYEESPQFVQTKPVFETTTVPEAQKVEVKPSLDFEEVLTFSAVFLWISVGVFMMIFSLIKLLKLKNRLKSATKIEDNIFSSDKIETAFVLGIFSPKIYLPTAVSDNEKEFILLHEKTHIKRFDHILRIISYLVLCLHWFNPLVWVAYILSGKDMEMSCDEAVVKKLGCKKEYASSLLSLATKKKIISPLSFGEGDTKARIKNILSYKKPTFWVIFLGFIAVGVAIFIFAANPVSKQDDDISSETASTTFETETETEIADFSNEIEVEFKEFAIEEAVKKQLEKNFQPVYESELELITELNLNNDDFSSLEDLKLFPNLVHLFASNCDISDLSELSNLNQLKILGLSQNEITDLSPLSELKNLQYLDVSNNYYDKTGDGGNNAISDLSPLSELTNLVVLKVEANNISDISVLENMTNLCEFFASGNKISDISPLTNLENLERLVLYDNNISDLTPLKNMSKQLTLGISNNSFIDWTPVSHIYSIWNSMTDYHNLIDSADYTATADEISEIQDLLVNYRDFTKVYFQQMQFGAASELLDFDDYIQEQVQHYNMYGELGKPYDRFMYRLSEGEITSASDFTDKLHSIYTDKTANMHEEYYTKGVDYYRAVDDKLYAWEYGGGGFLGYSTTYISEIGKLSDGRYVIYLTSIGDSDFPNWSLETDKFARCYFILEKTADGFRIDSCPIGATIASNTYNPEDDFSDITEFIEIKPVEATTAPKDAEKPQVEVTTGHITEEKPEKSENVYKLYEMEVGDKIGNFELTSLNVRKPNGDWDSEEMSFELEGTITVGGSFKRDEDYFFDYIFEFDRDLLDKNVEWIYDKTDDGLQTKTASLSSIGFDKTLIDPADYFTEEEIKYVDNGGVLDGITFNITGIDFYGVYGSEYRWNLDFTVEREAVKQDFTDEEIASYIFYDTVPDMLSVTKPDFTMDTSFVNSEASMKKIMNGFMNDDFSDETAVYWGIETSPHYPTAVVSKIYFEDNKPMFIKFFQESVLVEINFEIDLAYDTPNAYVFTAVKEKYIYSILKQDFRYDKINDSEKSVDDYAENIESATEIALKLHSTARTSPDGENKISSVGILIHTNYDELKPDEDYRAEVSEVVEILGEDYFKINAYKSRNNRKILLPPYYVGCEDNTKVFSTSEVDGSLISNVYTAYSVYSKIHG